MWVILQRLLTKICPSLSQSLIEICLWVADTFTLFSVWQPHCCAFYLYLFLKCLTSASLIAAVSSCNTSSSSSFVCKLLQTVSSILIILIIISLQSLLIVCLCFTPLQLGACSVYLTNMYGIAISYSITWICSSFSLLCTGKCIFHKFAILIEFYVHNACIPSHPETMFSTHYIWGPLASEANRSPNDSIMENLSSCISLYCFYALLPRTSSS